MNAYEKATGWPEVQALAAKLDDLGFTDRWVLEDRWGLTLQCKGNGQTIRVGASNLVKAYRYAVERAAGKSEVKS